MCKRCIELRKVNAPKDAFPNHVFVWKGTRDLKIRRAERLKKYLEDRRLAVVEIPVHLADPQVRRVRITAVREKLRLTQREFAAVLGVSESMVRKIEDGERKCTMPMLKLAERELAASKRRHTVEEKTAAAQD